MLYAINIENAHRHGDVMPQLLRLRYRQFKERQNYEVRVYNNMEFDQYDTPETVYLVWLDEQRQVGGTSRLNSTCGPYMLKDIWADMIEGHELPYSSDVWEGTRICIDKALPGALREPGHPLRRRLLQLLGVPLQLIQIVERIGSIQLAGVNQAHEQIAYLCSIASLVKQGVLAMQDGLLQCPLTDIVIQRRPPARRRNRVSLSQYLSK
jgi:hypothetical protein